MSKRQPKKQITQGNVGNDEDELSSDEAAQPSQGFSRADDSVLKQRRIVTAKRRGGAAPTSSSSSSGATQGSAAVVWDLGQPVQGSGIGFGSAAASSADSDAEFKFSSDSAVASNSEFVFGGTNAADFNFSAPSPFSTAAAADSTGFTGGFGSGGSFGGFGDASGQSSLFGGGGNFSFPGTGSGFGSGPVVGGFMSDSASKQHDEDGADGDGGNDDPEAEVDPIGFAPTSAPLVAVQEVKNLTTGEEGEKYLFPPTRSKLFQFKDGEWKECGVGKVSLNVSETEERQARILFRAEQVGTIRLNAGLFVGMKVDTAGDKGVSVLTIVDGVPQRYYVKFAKPSEATTFLDELKKKIASLDAAPKSSSTDVKKAVASAAPDSAAEVKKAVAPAPVVAVSPKRVEAQPVTPEKKRSKADPPTTHPVVLPTVAACVLEGSHGVRGVVTINQPDSMEPALVEATFEGLHVGKQYKICVGPSFTVVGTLSGAALPNERAILVLKSSVLTFTGEHAVQGKMLSVVAADNMSQVLASGIAEVDSPLLKE